MRKLILAALAVVGLTLGGPAVASPPDTDPTCNNPQQTEESCAGDNGNEGCDGVNNASGNTPPESDEGIENASNILEPGAGDDDTTCESS